MCTHQRTQTASNTHRRSMFSPPRLRIDRDDYAQRCTTALFLRCALSSKDCTLSYPKTVAYMRYHMRSVCVCAPFLRIGHSARVLSPRVAVRARDRRVFIISYLCDDYTWTFVMLRKGRPKKGKCIHIVCTQMLQLSYRCSQPFRRLWRSK